MPSFLLLAATGRRPWRLFFPPYGGIPAGTAHSGRIPPPSAAFLSALRRYPCRDSTLRVLSAALGGILLCCCRNKFRRLLSLCGNRKCGIITDLFAELCRNDPADCFAPAERLSTDHRLGIRPKQILTPGKNAADDDHLRIE